MIVIDYLQLIEPDNSKDPRQEQVAKIARRLKGVSRELNVPLLCLSQLNRQAEDSKDHRPKLSHLRESGAIEQDADVVMFVHREEYYHRGDDRAQYAGQAEIIISKQRNGPIGDVELTWEADYTQVLGSRRRTPQRVRRLRRIHQSRRILKRPTVSKSAGLARNSYEISRIVAVKQILQPIANLRLAAEPTDPEHLSGACQRAGRNHGLGFIRSQVRSRLCRSFRLYRPA